MLLHDLLDLDLQTFDEPRDLGLHRIGILGDPRGDKVNFGDHGVGQGDDFLGSARDGLRGVLRGLRLLGLELLLS